MTTRAQMRRYLQEHGWSRHQQGYAWCPPPPAERSFFNIEAAYTMAVTSENKPAASPPEGAREDVRP
jgi:hypothetical protein